MDSSEEPTEISERRGSGRRRPDPDSHPFVTTIAGESQKGTEVVNVNLNVKDQTRNKNRRFRRRRNRFRQPQRQSPTLIQRLRLLFNPTGQQGFSSGYTPLFSRLFRPYSNNFNNRFPNRGNGRRRGRPQRPFQQQN